ncbi:ABC transporter ATP-binding protein [Propionibacterium freudenreichii]|uniref:ABC transporter ATP-binding protein n=1 Tax=Propionibacterium freudenreichii TaxID=1744 RepID=UPI003851C7F1
MSPTRVSTAIEINGLVKTFGRVTALDGVDLSVQSGEVHGFLGPNGAGKSTTIRILLGLLRADSGSARVLGADPWADVRTLHERLAYVPGDVNLWPNLTGGQVIDLLARLRGDLNPARRDELLERFDLDPTKKARSYSKGNRQKVALVAALASDAELFLFDEPTSGLDPLMEAAFDTSVQELKGRGATVLLSSHILPEVEELSDRISIIKAGRIIETATLEQMRAMHTTSVSADVQREAPELGTMPGISQLRTVGGHVSFVVDAAHLDQAITVLTRAGITSLVSEPPSLEELFLSKYADPVPTGTPAAPSAGDQR